MKNPNLIPKPFAQNGQKDAIPTNHKSDLPSQKATWDTGFPQITMMPVTAGGLPPSGRDFNGILNQISDNIVYLSQGGKFKYSQEYADSTGGYPKGAILQSDDETKEFQSLTDNNKINFNKESSEKVSAAWKQVSTTLLLDELNKKLNRSDVVQSVGNSKSQVMSQNAVTDTLNTKQDKGDYATNSALNQVNDNANSRLEKAQNGADIQDKAAFVNNLGLRDTVDRASHSLDTRTGGKVNGNVTTNQLFTQAVTISDGSIAAGKLDAASFEGNNIEIRSWNGIGLNSTYENPNNVASIYFDTRGGSIGLQGDISGPKWGGSFSDWVDRKTQQALTKSANGADIPDKKAFANNLGLTETAYRTIGNGTHQIPDMSFFTSGRDWFKMPDGRTIQYGLVNFSQDNDVFFYAKVRFPIPFTDRPMCVQATLNGMGSVDVYLPNLGIDLKDNMSVDIVLPKQRITRIPREQSVFWIAIGY